MTDMDKKQRTVQILRTLAELYPEAGAELHFTNPFETLIATILSAQCTDKRVNMVTETLFRRYPDAQSLSEVQIEELEELIKPCGLYRMKARHIIDACKAISERYGGEVPRDRVALTSLPGVGNKTASVVLMAAYGEDVMPVDTHVFRLAHRLDLVENANTPDEVARQLTNLIPEGERGHAYHLLIWHGRRCCKAIKPECGRCPLRGELCGYKSGSQYVCR